MQAIVTGKQNVGQGDWTKMCLWGRIKPIWAGPVRSEEPVAWEISNLLQILCQMTKDLKQDSMLKSELFLTYHVTSLLISSSE